MKNKEMNVKAWIQNPDEEKGDFVLKNGFFVPVEEKEQRGEYTNFMFQLQENGKQVLKQKGLEIIRSKEDKGLFLVNMNAENKDKHGRRIAVMLLLENYQENKDNELGRLIEETFNQTHTQVSKETLSEIRNNVKEAYNKLSSMEILGVFLNKNWKVIVIILVALASIYFILKNLED